jgi:hypothetical protein
MTPQEQKQLIKLSKFYFSSLSGRKGAYLYLGVSDSSNTFILSNQKPDELIKFCDATLSLHIVKIHNSDDLNAIKSIFKHVGIDTKKTQMVVHITKVLSYLVECGGDLESMEIYTNDIGIIYRKSPKDGSHVPLAWPLIIFQAVTVLNRYYEMYKAINSDELEHITYPITIEQMKDKNLHVIKCSMRDYIDKFKKYNEECDIKDLKNEEFEIYLMDGLETVATKETFKAYKDSIACNLITWAKDGYIEYVSLFSAPNVTVISTRPHMRYYPKFKKSKSTKNK